MMTAQQRADNCLLSLETALFRACKDRRGSIGAICELYGLKVPTLTSKLNPALDTHHCNPADIEAVLSYTKDSRIMDAVCAAHGNAVWYELPTLESDDDCELFAVFGDLSKRVGDLGHGLFASMSDGVIDADELDALRKYQAQLHTATAALIAAAERHQANK